MTKQQAMFNEEMAMRRYLFGWAPKTDREKSLQDMYRKECERVYNDANPCGYKRPSVQWKAKAKAFALFDRGLTPKDISPRKVDFISRTSLYTYYSHWQTIMQAEIDLWDKLRKFCMAERERRSVEWSTNPRTVAVKQSSESWT
ncbi:MAG: hypothetical protein JSW38_10300 [Dehalococcoidia bacterium]|nr:MAG: hypothetical protein JSW38_10300 [Dehalococcoidia bacterium]